jgi:hypothetical protein
MADELQSLSVLFQNQEESMAKRIPHSADADVHNPNFYRMHFSWLVTQFDKLCRALDAANKEAPSNE